MAVTVTTDLVLRHSMDALANALAIVVTTLALEADSKIEGVGSLSARFAVGALNTPAGVAGAFTAADISKLHVLTWVNNLDKADTKANGGWRIRIAADNTAITTNFGEWTVGGNDAQYSAYEGFSRWCVDPNRPFDFVTGTPAVLTAIGSIAAITKATTASGRTTWFSDAFVTATGITYLPLSSNLWTFSP